MLRHLLLCQVVASLVSCDGDAERGPPPALDPRYRAGDVMRLYAAACRDGAGDPSSCRRVAIALMRGEGYQRDRPRADALFGAACDAGDGASCVYAFFSTPHLYEVQVARLGRARAACAGGDRAACDALAELDALPAWPDGDF